MKTITKFALLLTMLAAGNSAMAQQGTYVQGCRSYNFPGTTATGTDISYQWYRNGQPIPDANGENYFLPAKQAYGVDVEFKRAAISSSCPGEVTFSNAFYLTFSGVRIDTICWAHTNVDAPYTFAAQPDMYTQFYQWNRTTPWPAEGNTVNGWNSIPNEDTTWIHNPCPAGWRLPERTEFVALYNAGSTWVAAYTKGNAMNGRFYGPNHATCSLPSNMAGCVFLPAMGMRNGSNGESIYLNASGIYWSSTQYVVNTGFYLGFDASSIYVNYDIDKAYALSVRCVQ